MRRSSRLSRRPLRLDRLEARTTPATLMGFAFDDPNLNGAFDQVVPAVVGGPAPEQPVAGAMVELDLAADGKIDATVTTAADGSYTFRDVPDGTHNLRAIVPAGRTPTTITPLTVRFSGGSFVPDPVPLFPDVQQVGRPPIPVRPQQPFDFGFVASAVVAGGVFADADGDNTADPGERGFPDVVVNLDKGGDGSVEFTAATNFAGDFALIGVPDGTYTAAVVTGARFQGKVPTRSVEVSGGKTVTGVTFAVVPVGGVSGVVFEDLNLSRFFDAVVPPVIGGPVAERGLAGIEVRLDLNNDGTTDGTTTTAEDGSYAFTDIPDGGHALNVSAAGFTATTPQPAFFAIFEGVLIPPPVPAIAPPPPGFRPRVGVLPNSDFFFPTTPAQIGLAKSALIALGAFADADGDGTQSFASPEPGIPGVLVSIDFGSDGSIDLSRPTNEIGNLPLAGIPDGKHTAKISPVDGFTNVTPSAITFEVAGGKTVTGLTFALRPVGAVEVRAFDDANGNGVRDAGEAGVDGATVELDLDGDGTFDRTAEPVPVIAIFPPPLPSGRYPFSGVPDGMHRVRITPPAGYVVPDRVPNPQAAFVEGGGTVNVEFGLTKLVPAVVSGNAFYDANGNGLRDPGELPVAGLRVNLVTPTGLPPAGGFDAATSGPDGVLRFTGVRDGTYKLVVPARPGYEVTTPFSFFTITNGAGVSDAPVGIRPAGNPPAVGTITGTVFLDADGDGVRDSGDIGAAGARVAVRLTGTDDPMIVATTAADGSYTLSGLPDGAHQVTATLPGGPPTPPVTVVISNGQLVLQNLGVRPARGVGGQVFFDPNGDGVRGTGELAVPGATVELDLNSDGTADRTTTTTPVLPPNPVALVLAAGLFNFADVPDGNHTVRVVLPGAKAPAATATVTVIDGRPSVTNLPIGVRFAGPTAVAVGAESGSGVTRVFDGNGQLRFELTPFPTQAAAGTRAATGDLTGDGVADVAVGVGPGASAPVRVFDGATKAELFAVETFESGSRTQPSKGKLQILDTGMLKTHHYCLAPPFPPIVPRVRAGEGIGEAKCSPPWRQRCVSRTTFPPLTSCSTRA